jgi:hypothetical protein
MTTPTRDRRVHRSILASLLEGRNTPRFGQKRDQLVSPVLAYVTRTSMITSLSSDVSPTCTR